MHKCIIILHLVQNFNAPNRPMITLNLRNIIAIYNNIPIFYFQYNAVLLGQTGAGGEYTPQTGFGWSNGLLFQIFDHYGRILNSTRHKKN